jgi:hypothetical protein
MADKTPNEMAEELARFLNNFSCRPSEDLVKAMLLQHRTLQQAFSRFCLRWFESLAETPHGFDKRNEASVELAKEIVKIDKRKRSLPLI